MFGEHRGKRPADDDGESLPAVKMASPVSLTGNQCPGDFRGVPRGTSGVDFELWRRQAGGVVSYGFCERALGGAAAGVRRTIVHGEVPRAGCWRPESLLRGRPGLRTSEPQAPLPPAPNGSDVTAEQVKRPVVSWTRVPLSCVAVFALSCGHCPMASCVLLSV